MQGRKKASTKDLGVTVKLCAKNLENFASALFLKVMFSKKKSSRIPIRQSTRQAMAGRLERIETKPSQRRGKNVRTAAAP
jgi:hypothetical protein